MNPNLLSTPSNSVFKAFFFLFSTTVVLLLFSPDILAQQSASMAGSQFHHGNMGDEELHWAAFRGHVGSVQKILESGAKVDQQVEKGSTALHMAAYNGHLKVIELLIENGADVNARTEDGIAPLDWSRSNGHAEAESLLLAHGAREGKRLPVKKQGANGDRPATVVDSNPARALLAQSGEYRLQPPSNSEEYEIDNSMEAEEWDKLESVSNANQIIANYRAEKGFAASIPVGEVVEQGVEPKLNKDVTPEAELMIPAHRVQLAALTDHARAVALRGHYIEYHAHILGERDLKVEKFSAPGRDFYRIRSVPLSRNEAALLCDRLRLNDQDCFVIQP